MVHGAQRRILWLALVWCMLAHAATLHAQSAPRSVWWYPDGTPEATNRNITTTKSQVDSQLVVRWRTTALRGATTVLVGAIRTRSSLAQEVVGIMGDTLVILSADGATLLDTSYRNTFPPSLPFTLRLTGLFNPAGSFFSDRPGYIGIGVEREQTRSPDDNLWAFLADNNGVPTVKIVAGRIPDNVNEPARRTAGIYPVAGYTPPGGGGPTVVTVVTQDQLVQRSTTYMNGLLRHSMVVGQPPGQAQPRDGYPVAPKTYPASPSLFSDGLVSTIGLGTSPYRFTDTVIPVGGGLPTRSDEMYSIAFADSATTLRHMRTVKMPPDTTHPGGSTRSHVLTLYESPGAGGSNYRLIAENHSPQDPGTPRLRLMRLETLQDAPSDTVFGEIVDNAATNHGWKVVAADIDGSGVVNRSRTPPSSLFLNNAFDEILAARSLPGDPDIADNELRLIRLNAEDITSPGGGLAMREFGRQAFKGRLMCAGDLAADSLDTLPAFRQEVVIANGSQVSILRLFPYRSPNFDPAGNRYFETIRSFDLDSRVLDCAIADLDGDEENELIVTTQKATYAIGRPHPQPFYDIGADTTKLCIGDSTTVRWRRRLGGGEEGVLLALYGSAGRFRLGRRDTSMVGTDSFVVRTAGLPPGEYTLRIADSLVPSAINDSLTITVLASSIGVPTASALSTTLDSTIRLASQVVCPDQPLLLRSIEGGAWDTLAPSPLLGDSAIATTVIICTPSLACLDRDSLLVSFKFADPTKGTESAPIPMVIRLPRPALALEPGDTSRTRTREIRWRRSDFSCSTLELSLSPDNGKTWRSLGTVSADREQLSLTVSDDIVADSVRLRLCCTGNPQPGCTVASVEFEIDPPAPANYIAPNPFNPLRGTARIVYRLNRPGRATATILDAGRGVVARLNDETGGGEAGRRSLVWDGRTSRGGIVATGSYICVVESDGGESILIPFYVMQR